MNNSVSQALGLLTATLGSSREYNAADYKRRIQMAVDLLEGRKYSAEVIREDMHRQAFLDAPPEATRVSRVREAFNSLNEIYGFQGESGTEELLCHLDTAVHMAMEEVDRSHEEDGLCTDCVSLLASELDAAIEQALNDSPVEQAKALAYVQ